MRILVAHNYYQQPGGEDQVVAAEIQLLRSRGHDVQTYFLHNDVIHDMHPLTVAGKTLWNRESAAQLGDVLEQHQPSIVHFHNTFPLISPAAYYAAKRVGAAVVQTLHNYRLLCPNGQFYRDGKICEDCHGKALPWPAVAHGCYRGSRAGSVAVAAMLAAHRVMGTWRRAVDIYIALTEFGRDKFIAGGLPADRVVIKPNFLPSPPRPGRGEGGYAIFIGRLSEEKGVDLLLCAWRESGAALSLKVVGDGPLAADVKTAVAENPRIQWLGRRPFPEVCDLIGSAACVVTPSLCYEGLPRTIVEAFALGTPVIAPRLGGMAHLVEHERNGLHFEPGDSDDLAAQVRWLIDHEQQLPGMRKAARREFEAHYTADRNYEMLMEIYHRAAPRSMPRLNETRGAA